MKRIIQYKQVKHATYFHEFNIDSFPIISGEEMNTMLKKIGWFNNQRKYANTNNKLRIIINGIRVSIRRTVIIMRLFPDKKFDYEYVNNKFVIKSEGNIYDFKPYTERGIITKDNISITPIQ